jgi:putative glutamine amidotransferase
MMPSVLVTRGARVHDIHSILTDLGASVHILAPGDDLREAFDAASRVLIPGGADIDPALYGEACTWARPFAPDRDDDEAELVGWALAEAKPLMGICRGHQMIAAIAGGTLYQDLGMDADVAHVAQHHRIRVDTRSRLAGVTGGWCLVNSYHHQAVKRVPAGWRVVAESFDAVVEAIEHPTLPVISVQWHPESLDDDRSLRLFQQFLSLKEV